MSECLLVTGGAGFIGSNFVRHVLAHTDHRIVTLDKLTYAGSRENLADLDKHPRHRFVHGDIADADTVEGLLDEERPVGLLNFAAETHVDRSIDTPWPFVGTNVVGTFRLLEAARRYWRGMTSEARAGFRFLHVSTDEVFGSLGSTGRFVETTPYAPNSPYAASKASADHLVRAYNRTFDLPTLITNCSNNYGPYQFPEKLIPLMLLNALEGRPLPIYGDGGNVRDWLYVEDHCEGILAVLGHGRPGDSYNLGGNCEKTNVEVVDAICDTLERLRPAADNPRLRSAQLRAYRELKTFVADRKGHDRRYAIDATKVQDELGWRPRHDFAEGLESTVRWYLEHLDWCEKVQRQASYHRERLGEGES